MSLVYLQLFSNKGGWDNSDLARAEVSTRQMYKIQAQAKLPTTSIVEKDCEWNHNGSQGQAWNKELEWQQACSSWYKNVYCYTHLVFMVHINTTETGGAYRSKDSQVQSLLFCFYTIWCTYLAFLIVCMHRIGSTVYLACTQSKSWFYTWFASTCKPPSVVKKKPSVAAIASQNKGVLELEPQL